MSKLNSSELSSLVIDLDDRTNENNISVKVKELINSGCAQIDLVLEKSPDENTNKIRIDTEMFIRIKEIQDLPDWVIIKLILASRKLEASGIQERISNA